MSDQSPSSLSAPPAARQLDKTFEPATVEHRLYAGWESSGAFAGHPENPAPGYCIVIPPPNVTGSLHIGHALDNTLQDILVRWRRMQGRDVLWQPGTDHAGIATQMVVERLLGTQGVKRREIGREKFLEHVWEWKAQSGGTITRQLRRLGASLDWSRERFTMDEGLSVAVREVFVTLAKQGLLYRDQRLVNWDPVFQTAISDLEVESREVKGSLWYIRYPVAEAPGRFITVATTRPETMLADTAVAVHPEDERFRDLVGRHVILPVSGRRVPVVADEYSDPEKGTGAVKITPAHDFNDFEVGKRHGLAAPSMLDAEGRVTLVEIAPQAELVDGVADPAFLAELEGVDRFAARKAIVAELERLELLEKIEPHTHQVPHGDRSGVPIEPRLTMQWYADAATLAKPAIEAVESGRTEFVPKQWENTFFAWMRDIQPWCVSRQLWWGHQIPAWYGPDGEVFVERNAAEAAAAAEKHYGHAVELRQDEDVLDTWFSSALWPFSTLGWPEQTPALAKYYPTDVLVTGFDIIFFWVARMMMMGIHFMGEVPFRTVYIHGLVRDEKGQKMSKSKGNVMDPLELIDEYGADAVRFTLAALAGPGRDVKMGKSRIEGYRAFGTKLWNASRFAEMNGIRPDASFDPAAATTPLARWILDATNAAVAEANASLEAFRFDEYAQGLYRFVWNTYCDWFVEFSKRALAADADPAEAAEVRGAAQHVLGVILRLLHPVMPFITTELWERFGYGSEGDLIRAPWPEAVAVREPETARSEFGWVIALISEIRTVRAEMNVPVAAKPVVSTVIAPGEADADFVTAWRERNGGFILRLARLAEFRLPQGAEAVRPGNSAAFVVGGRSYAMDLAGHIDLAAERTRLAKEQAKAEGEARKVEAKLGNADFVSRAKPEVVEENRERLVAFRAEMERLAAALARIGG